MTNERIEARLAELRGERDRGEEMLAELQQRQAALRDTLLRIHGAIQVLEELQQSAAGAEADEPAPSIAIA
jgi:predicted nuclease with TOPRIM domain